MKSKDGKNKQLIMKEERIYVRSCKHYNTQARYT